MSRLALLVVLTACASAPPQPPAPVPASDEALESDGARCSELTGSVVPAPADVIDTAAVARAIRGASGHVLLSVYIDSATTRARTIETSLPAARADAAARAVNDSGRLFGPYRRMAFRVRAAAGTNPEIRLGPSVWCHARLLNEAVVQREMNLTARGQTPELTPGSQHQLTLDFQVRIDGSIDRIALRESTGNARLDSIAVDVARRVATFRPGTLDGFPAADAERIPFSIRVSEKRGRGRR